MLSPHDYRLHLFALFKQKLKIIKDFPTLKLIKGDILYTYVLKTRGPSSVGVYYISFISFSEGFVLLWKKGEDFVAVGDKIVNPSDARLQLVKETNGNTLVISLAEEEDAGDYVCQVSTYKPIEIKHSVKIRGKSF